MKSIVGLLEYTVTGAFVWILFAVFLGWIAIDAPSKSIADVWLGWARRLPSIPHEFLASTKPVHDVLSLALGGAFLVAIFVTGAVLDLAASSVFLVLEIRWAKTMLARTHGWMRRLIDEEGAFVRDDYEHLLRRRDGKAKPVEWEFGRYRRVTGFLLGYVLATAKPAQVEEVQERLKLWRVTQSIGLSLVLLIFAAAAWTLAAYDVGVDALKALMVGVLLPSLCLIFAYLLARQTFARLAVSLESALYIGFTQSRRAVAIPAREPSARAGVRGQAA